MERQKKPIKYEKGGNILKEIQVKHSQTIHEKESKIQKGGGELRSSQKIELKQKQTNKMFGI